MAETASASPTTFKPLRLLAEDADDLAIIAAALEEAEARIGDIEWESTGRRLTVAFDRLRREAAENPAERVHSGFQLGGVLGVKTRHLDRSEPDAVLQLLNMSFEAGETPGGVVTFAFTGDADLAATVECIDAALADVSEPWAAE
jgi:hypothetical protein